MNLRRVLLETKFSSSSVLPVGQQLAHLLARHRLLQDDLAALEVAGDVRADRVLADVAACRARRHGPGTWGRRPGSAAGREVDRLARFAFALGVLAEVELELPVLDLVVVGQLQLGGEGPAGLGAEALQRADLLVAQEGLDLGQLEAAPARDLGDGEAAAGVLGQRRPRRCRRSGGSSP